MHATRFSSRLYGLAAFGMAAMVAAPAGAQKAPAVRDLGPVTAITTERIGLSAGVWEFANGNVLVSDAIGHRLLLFDASLAKFTPVGDSTGALPITYRALVSPLIPFTSDSVLFLDFASRSMQLIGSNGAVVRTVAPVKAADMVRIRNNTGGADPRGRLYYRGVMPSSPVVPGAPRPLPSDSAPIVRADFDSRKVDTIAVIQRPADAPPVVQVKGPDGKISFKMIVNPVVWIDEWALTPDGTVAIVRGHDYHVDWIAPDGRITSSPKMPFDWRPLTDADKQNLMDSVRKSLEPRDMGGRGGMSLQEAQGYGLIADDLHLVTNADGSKRVPVALDFVPLSDMHDYVAPIRFGAVQSDRDGNIWILPTTSSRSRKGGLVYDVVNGKGELFERVELPAGRSIAAFGRNGSIYLLNGDRTNGFAIERARIR